ncbi:hypothetical protein Vadar_011827 [Vaccinium darrowii]|uniref:Uncharacterized protein n=1 Tax=Vaccinium darrowii TaxID=229202 RepID=A0ACB7ZIZ8_9ERIC|nr:hypothetical protein Vadar_011827 [Vaccinium darrowii]
MLEIAGGPADMTASKEIAKVMVQNARESAAGEESGAMMTRVAFAVSQLEEDAVQWWRLIDRTLTWQEFRHLFMDKYFLLIFRHALEHDFLQLTQRGITVIEYEAEFSELARYALELVPDEETRIRRFLRGLKITLQHRNQDSVSHQNQEIVAFPLKHEEQNSEVDKEKGYKIVVDRSMVDNSDVMKTVVDRFVVDNSDVMKTEVDAWNIDFHARALSSTCKDENKRKSQVLSIVPCLLQVGDGDGDGHGDEEILFG